MNLTKKNKKKYSHWIPLYPSLYSCTEVSHWLNPNEEQETRGPGDDIHLHQHSREESGVEKNLGEQMDNTQKLQNLVGKWSQFLEVPALIAVNNTTYT